MSFLKNSKMMWKTKNLIFNIKNVPFKNTFVEHYTPKYLLNTRFFLFCLKGESSTLASTNLFKCLRVSRQKWVGVVDGIAQFHLTELCN